MGSVSNSYQIGNKTCYISKVSKFYVENRISMLTGLKVLSLPCKCVILQTRTYCKGGDTMELNFEGLEIPK